MTSIDVGNPTTNVIPVRAEAMFNIRYNDRHTAETLQTRVRELAAKFLEPNGLDYELTFEPPSQAFLTEPGSSTRSSPRLWWRSPGSRRRSPPTAARPTRASSRRSARWSSSASSTKTIHKIDEQVSVADLEQLTAVYRRFLDLYFEEFGIFELV